MHWLLATTLTIEVLTKLEAGFMELYGDPMRWVCLKLAITFPRVNHTFPLFFDGHLGSPFSKPLSEP